MKKEKNLILISSMAILLTALLECIVIVTKPNLIAIFAIGVCMLINVFILLSNILHIVEERHEEHLQEEAQLISQLQMLSKKIDRRLELLERVGKANYTATNRIREAQTNCFSVTNSLLEELKHNQFQTAQLIAKYNTVAHNKNLEDRHRQMASLLKCLDKNLENLSLGEISTPPALPDFHVDFSPVIDTLENGFITVGERLEQLQRAGLAPAGKSSTSKPAAKSKPATSKSGVKPKPVAAAKPDVKPEPDIKPELTLKSEPTSKPMAATTANIENVTQNAVVTEITPVTEPESPAAIRADISEQAEHLAAALETIPQISAVPDEPVIEYIPEPELDIMPEPVPIPIARQEPEPVSAPSNDAGHMMSPDEIAALISGGASEPKPAPEPEPVSSDDAGHMMSPDEIAALISGGVSEPKPAPEPEPVSSDDAGHMMSPDEIAALISGGASEPKSEPEPAPIIEDIPVPELKPLDEDPNRSLTADEIAALFSNG